MVALAVLLATVVVEAAPAGLLVVVGATRGLVAGKPVEVRVVADPVFAGPVVGLGAADAGALAVVVGALAVVGALGAAVVDLAAASGFAVTGLLVAEEGLAAVEVVLAVTLVDVEVTVFFWTSVVLASPLTSFFSVTEGAGFLSAVPTVLVREDATFGDLAPTVDVLAAADGTGAVFFTAGAGVALAAVGGFAAGLLVVLAATVVFLAAAPVVGALAVLATEFATRSGVFDLDTFGSSLGVAFSAVLSSTASGLTSSVTCSLTMAATGSARVGSVGASFGTASGICSTTASFSTTHSSSFTGSSSATGTGEIGAS